MRASTLLESPRRPFCGPRRQLAIPHAIAKPKMHFEAPRCRSELPDVTCSPRCRPDLPDDSKCSRALPDAIELPDAILNAQRPVGNAKDHSEPQDTRIDSQSPLCVPRHHVKLPDIILSSQMTFGASYAIRHTQIPCCVPRCHCDFSHRIGSHRCHFEIPDAILTSRTSFGIPQGARSAHLPF